MNKYILIIALLFYNVLMAQNTQKNSFDFPVIFSFKAKEAHQGVAVDQQYVYAIKTKKIGQYHKKTGKFVKKWKSKNSKIIHLNSGLIIKDKLYCAHSNWPNTPMESSIEIWDTKTLTHYDSIIFENPIGSCTWVDKYNGYWWVCFAHYSKKGGEVGKGVEMTTVVKYNNQWKSLDSWKFPVQVIEKFLPYSCSGGAWGPDGLLYVSGHDKPELYALKLPNKNSRLEFVKTFQVDSFGQGIAFDRTSSDFHLYTIKRKDRLVIVSKPLIQKKQ